LTVPYKLDVIDPLKTALIVVDMENDFIAAGAPMECPAGRAMMPTLKRVIDVCRSDGIAVIYTAHVHRRDGSDMGLFDDLYPAIAKRAGLVDGDPGSDIHPDLAPKEGEFLIKKHRYSAFYGTDLDIILRGRGIDTVIVTGVTTENCCHATARDAMFHDYRVVVLADATATHDYPDLGWGGMAAADVHRATLVILAYSTAHVMSSDELIALMRANEPSEALSPQFGH
jgi:biuret amidohydrolase